MFVYVYLHMSAGISIDYRIPRLYPKEGIHSIHKMDFDVSSVGSRSAIQYSVAQHSVVQLW